MRRILEKPWAADPFLKQVIDMFIRGRQCIAQLIQHSEVWAEEYRQRVNEQMPGLALTDARNLRVARHRIEAIATPMGRAVLHLPALLATAVAVAVKRKGKPEGKQAQQFLEWVDVEKCLQLAMVADAGADGMAFKNFWDSEQSDPARSSMEIETFRAKLSAMWVDGHCVGVGFTAHMIGLLREPVTLPSSAVGFPKTIGAHITPEDAVFKQCLGRMRAFASMALSCLQAEFPHWDVLQSFSIFLLGTRGGRRCLIGEEADREAAAQCKLSRLCNVFDVPYAAAQSQYQLLLPLAQQEYLHHQQASNVDAWRAALTRVRDRRLRGHYPSSEIGQLLARYAAFVGCTTQGQESAFSVQTAILTPQRNHMSESREMVEMKLAIDVDSRSTANVCAKAARIWVQLYGNVRKGCAKKLRISNHRPRPGKARALPSASHRWSVSFSFSFPFLLQSCSSVCPLLLLLLLSSLPFPVILAWSSWREQSWK
jgi:hypothetical protein